jgi:AcrR family transcriptional regulator
MSSQNASDTIDGAALARAKAPQRERGRARVAALLEAAGLEFVEKGYEAATMTAIAARAGSSIGSLYQFFATKDLVANALLGGYLDALVEHLQALRDAAPGLDLDELGRRTMRALVEFRDAHPAFATLAETRGTALPVTLGIRERLRGEIGAILRAVAPGLPPGELDTRAAVLQQLMKAAVALNADTGIADRAAALDQLEGTVRTYLHESIAAGMRRPEALP